MKKVIIRSLFFFALLSTSLFIGSCTEDEPNPNRISDAVNLASPINAATDIALDATLIWQAATDPDGDPITYDVYFGTEAIPVTVVSGSQTGTSYAPALAANTTYYWKVVAKDDRGGTSESTVWSFVTQNNGPGTVTLNMPTDAVSDVTLDALLTWQAVADPDGDAVTYDVYFGSDVSPVTVVTSSQMGTTYTPTLMANTTYYWKVVVKDGKGGTGESVVWSFTTERDITFDIFTDTRDGQVYKSVNIGTQTWMAENLAHLPSVSPTEEGSDTESYYHVYGYNGTNVNDAKATLNYKTYGVLYNWKAAITSCPTNWHLPSDAEWNQLEIFLDMDPSEADNIGWRRTGKIAYKLKTTSGWDPTISDTDGNGLDQYGFSALPGGYKYLNVNAFEGEGGIGYWWSSTEFSTTKALGRDIYSSSSTFRIWDHKVSGRSVRCVKD